MIVTPRRLLVTGGSGFIGSALLRILGRSGTWDEIHVVSRSIPDPRNNIQNIFWHQTDLLNDKTADAIMNALKPTHLIHGAWVTDHGLFWDDERNTAWLQASIRIADAFARQGGRRFINLGSVAEYEWSSGKMIEGETPEKPSSLYGQSKLSFCRHLEGQTKKGNFSAATGRIFFAYGPGEKPARLVPSICRSLLTGQAATFSNGFLWRDYLHVDDVACAILALIDSDLEGAVNLASGMPIRLSYFLDTLERQTGKTGFFQRRNLPELSNEVPILFGHASRLTSTGWRPIVLFEDGLSQTLEWWRQKQVEAERA
jgi:nucleoside-diphosphate-sugar epimerase